MPREKTVYPTKEIPHLWAHRRVEYARNPSDNLYTRDGVIYSYGSHFPIARHAEYVNEETGETIRVVLMTSREYSNTTSKHKHLVRMAIPDTLPTILTSSVRDTVESAVREHERSLADSEKELRDAMSQKTRKPTLMKLVRAYLQDWEYLRDKRDELHLTGLSFPDDLREIRNTFDQY